MNLTAEDLAKVETKNIANILRRQAEGKTLTASERRALTDAVASKDSPTPAVNYAATWGALATALGVSLRALKDWRGDPRYKGDCPRDRDDGRKDVRAWLAFMVRHGLARADQHIEHGGADPESGGTDDPADETGAPATIRLPPILGSESAWKTVKLAKEVEKKDIELAKLRNLLLVAAELEQPLGALLVAIQNKLSQFPERTAASVAGFSDVQEIIAILRVEIDADLADLHGAHYLEDLADIVAALPIATDDTRALVLEAAREALRRIGRRVIATVSEIPTEPLDAVTGQVTDEAEETHASMKNAAPSVASLPSVPPLQKPRTRKPRKSRRKANPPTPSVEATSAPGPRRRRAR